MSETSEQPHAEQVQSPTERRGTSADVDAIEHDLAGVEAALDRLDDGSYWTDEVTGDPIPVDVLADDPLARRRP